MVLKVIVTIPYHGLLVYVYNNMKDVRILLFCLQLFSDIRPMRGKSADQLETRNLHQLIPNTNCEVNRQTNITTKTRSSNQSLITLV